MALPRPTSIFTTLGNRNLGFTVAPTSMHSGNEPGDVSMYTEACDITECGDAEFDEWLGKQKPNLGAPDPVFEHKRFNNEMMQAWMTLSSAATEALIDFADNTYFQSRPSMPGPAMPHFPVLGPEIDYDAEAQAYLNQQAAITNKRDRAKKLLARARSVQMHVSIV